jgi:hypothetical protein
MQPLAVLPGQRKSQGLPSNAYAHGQREWTFHSEAGDSEFEGKPDPKQGSPKRCEVASAPSPSHRVAESAIEQHQIHFSSRGVAILYARSAISCKRHSASGILRRASAPYYFILPALGMAGMGRICVPTTRAPAPHWASSARGKGTGYTHSGGRFHSGTSIVVFPSGSHESCSGTSMPKGTNPSMIVGRRAIAQMA